jgi:hypothetical protein
MSLLIGLPTGGNPTAAFLESLRTVTWPERIGNIERMIVTGNFVPGQRELIARRALAENFTYLLMMDDDMVVPPNAVELLAQTLATQPQAALAGAVYYSRDGKRPMAVSRWRAEDTTDAVVPAFTRDKASEVDGIGFGCVLLRCSALRALDAPYFGTQIVLEAAHNHVRVCNEDYLLCERLRKAGFEIYLDGRVRCGHYDREQAVIFPKVWEDDTLTGITRMHVRQADGKEELVPFVEGGPRAAEKHQYATLDYLFIS